jgi:hypothetical protein
MPQPRRTAAKSTGAARSGAKRTSGAAKRSTGSTTKRATTSSASAKRSTSSASSSRASSSARSSAGRATEGAGDIRLDAVAQRVRKLNERIIEAGRDAGETTLTAYEKALKAIASSLDRGATASDVEWFSTLLSTQAKFVRDVTDTWTRAARGMLK